MSEVEDAIAAIEHPRKRADAEALLALFREASGFEPWLATPRLIGFGRYDYTYDSGHSGTSPATAFGLPKARIAIHIMPGYKVFPEIMARLGKHRTGASCVYINKLADADPEALKDLIRAGLADLATRWQIQPT